VVSAGGAIIRSAEKEFNRAAAEQDQDQPGQLSGAGDAVEERGQGLLICGRGLDRDPQIPLTVNFG
jgi:hypothetical protein